jgi:Predicted membrane protein
VLIDNGKVSLERLKKELISSKQLEAAARKQGFESLEAFNNASWNRAVR